MRCCVGFFVSGSFVIHSERQANASRTLLLPPLLSSPLLLCVVCFTFCRRLRSFASLLTPAVGLFGESFPILLSFAFRTRCPICTVAYCFGHRYLFTVARKSSFIANNFIKNVLTFSPTEVAYRKAFIGPKVASASLLLNSFVTRLL